MVVEVISQHDLEVSSSIGFILSFRVVLEHIKMYITITEIVGEKRIDLTDLIQGKDVAVISMHSKNFPVPDKGACESTADNK